MSSYVTCDEPGSRPTFVGISLSIRTFFLNRPAILVVATKGKRVTPVSYRTVVTQLLNTCRGVHSRPYSLLPVKYTTAGTNKILTLILNHRRTFVFSSASIQIVLVRLAS